MGTDEAPDAHKDMSTMNAIGREEEVQIADMEVRLRTMIIEVLKPTVHRATRLQTEYDVLVQKYEDMKKWLQEVVDSMKEAKERADMVTVFQGQLEKFWDRYLEMEGRMGQYEKATSSRMESIERDLDLSKSVSQRLSRSIDRSMQDMARYNASIKELQGNMELGMQRNKEAMAEEVRRIDNDMRNFQDTHKRFVDEVWGPEDIAELAPPSLRRFDLQMRKVNGILGEVVHDISDLRRLDNEMLTISKQQNTVEDQLKSLTSLSTKLELRVDTVAQETQGDMKRVSNLMAAFSANLMKESRANFSEDLKQAARLREEVEDFIKDTKDSIGMLDQSVRAAQGHAEAILKEVRIDLEGIDNRRKRDKSSFEEELHSLSRRIDASFDSADATLRGLEHVSGIISMSLQSERMSVALDLQDFVERKETPYVGVNVNTAEPTRPKGALTRATDVSRKGGLDPSLLARLTYRPQPLNFAGTSFERPQLLALREKLVHAAQEALQRGPDLKGASGSANFPRGSAHQRQLVQSSAVPQPVVAQVLGSTAADFTTAGGRRSTTPIIARPGSRGQPSARGSPMLEGDLGNTYTDMHRGSKGSAMAASLISASAGGPPSSAGAASDGKATTASDSRSFNDANRSWGGSRFSMDGTVSDGTNSVSPGVALPKLEQADGATSAHSVRPHTVPFTSR